MMISRRGTLAIRRHSEKTAVAELAATVKGHLSKTKEKARALTEHSKKTVGHTCSPFLLCEQ
jgi:hypothetical protein